MLVRKCRRGCMMVQMRMQACMVALVRRPPIDTLQRNNSAQHIVRKYCVIISYAHTVLYRTLPTSRTPLRRSASLPTSSGTARCGHQSPRTRWRPHQAWYVCGCINIQVYIVAYLIYFRDLWKRFVNDFIRSFVRVIWFDPRRLTV